MLDDSKDRKGYVFVMGDMNYRIDMDPEQVASLIKSYLVFGTHRRRCRQQKSGGLLRIDR